jgi:DNA-directed RNA polymerase specialized sigma24 family protein
LGTVSQEATPGTTADPGGDAPPVRFRGDELDLYLEFHAELVDNLAAAVRATQEDIEDACSFAWVQFFRYQPDRDREWKGWLYRTARREAWRLNAQSHRAGLRIVPDGEERHRSLVREPADPRDRLGERLEFLAALDELRDLPKNLRTVVIYRSQVSRHRDVAELMGINTARVGQLMQQVGVRLQERAERRAELERPVANPRAACLRELQLEPPKWLTEAIGTEPTLGKSAGGAVLAWRRAALAVDDYRRDGGWNSKSVGMGPKPDDPATRRAYDSAERAIAQLRRERMRQRGVSRER